MRLATGDGSTWLALLPSPSRNVWHLGPLPIRAYAMCLLAGIVVACVVGAKRLGQRGYPPELMYDVAIWAVPFGIVGARIYHVLSSPGAYFGPGGDPMKVFSIWEGGLGVWGSIALGAVGGLIAAKRHKIPVGILADSLAPGIVLGQAVGRLGNWFNQELFGGPTTLPWGLRVSADRALAAGQPDGTLFHPTFAYELVWNLLVFVTLIWLDRRLRLRHGQVFGLYMALYCLGRLWIEMLRVDPASHLLGLRLNVWTSVVIGLAGLAIFAWSRYHFRDTEEEDPDSETEPVTTAEPGADDAEPES